jgi:tetratricopeptide (TPR) repeat protein
MKYLFQLLCVLLFATAGAAQPGKKNEKEKPPTQKEMEEMMKEAEKMMGEMSPEDKKMMDSMGIKMPDFKKTAKAVSGITDKQLATAWEVENLIVPKKDNARINAISKTPLTAGSMGAFISDVNNKMVALLWPASKSLAEKMYTQMKAAGKNSDAIGNTATGLWIMGRLQPALYIMGKICADDASNTDNLSNYASMLSMCGVQQSAIPVLNYLDTQYPNNSTLINNLGQAWFGLGDMEKAEKYLDNVLRMYAWHPQAALTKSFIAESKGNKAEAVTLVKKSMLHSYSEEKEERLRKLGHKLTSKDVTLPKNSKADPLNLGGSVPPPYPMSVDECIALEPVWKTYRAQLKEQAAALSKQFKQAEQTAADMQQKRMNADLNMIKASMAAGSPQGVLTPVPIHAKAAYIKQNEVMEEYRRRTEELGKKMTSFFSGQAIQLKKDYEAQMEILREANLEQTGEGKPNKDYCPMYKAESDKYLRAYNSGVEPLFKEYLEIQKKYLNEMTHWQLYSEWPEKFEAYKIAAKISWLGALGAEPPISFESITQYKCAPPVQGKSGKLANFDDVACKYHSEITLFIGKMKSDCSRFTTEVDLGAIKLGLKQDMDKETFADQFMSCSVEVGAKVGKDVKMGPLSVEASAGARVGVEIDRTGVKDVYITGGVKAGAGTNIIGDAAEAAGTPSSALGQGVSDISIDGGVEGKISLVSGRGSIYGTGIFQK